MNTNRLMKNPWFGKRSIPSSLAGLILVVSVGCSPISSPTSEPPAPSVTESQGAATALLPTATSEAPIPDGWMTYTGQECPYAISYPPDMQVTEQGPYSETLSFKIANPDAGARNFLYVSVIPPEIQSRVKEGVYMGGDVYNYDPGETETLLNMQVGESKPLREIPNVTSGFTYERKPDIQISNHTAQVYENVQPWEFPDGTKEIRYTLSLNECTYLIGGYIDSTGSNQVGAIDERLFKQIIATMQLTP